MRALGRFGRWFLGKGVGLAIMLTSALMILLLPSMVVLVTRPAGRWVEVTGIRLDVGQWWELVTYHLKHLVQWELIPGVTYSPQGEQWSNPLDRMLASTPFDQVGPVSLRDLPSELARSFPVTLTLVTLAFVFSFLVGIGLGILISRFAPRWVRGMAWGSTTLLVSLPDLLVVTALDLGVFYVGRFFGFHWPGASSDGSLSWRQYVTPTIALTLLAIPYVARTTAAALDEVAGELYVRTAVAKGLSPSRVLLKHVGRPALARIWTGIPVVVGILVSGAAVVEYMSEIHGVGRALIMAAVPRGRMLYAAFVFVLPLMAFFALADILGDAGQRLLDPRLAEDRRPRYRMDWSGWKVSLRRVGRAPWAIASWLWRQMQMAPTAAVQGLKALRDPLLLSGVVLALVTVGVALLAPKLAPFSPTDKAMAYQAPSGKIFAPPFEPNAKYLLGTDDLGRDLFSRLLYGTRYALYIAALAIPLRFGMALLFGLTAAWRGGLWERFVRRMASFFSAIPAFLMPLVLIPVVNDAFEKAPSRALFWGVLFIAIPGFPRLAESIRLQAREVMVQPFIEGAQAVGAHSGRILLRHILPHLLPHLATMAALEVPAVLTTTALLGYFKAYPGGVIRDSQFKTIVGPQLPEWGSLMQPPFLVLLGGQWWMCAPFAALFLSVLAFNLLGEGLRRRWGTKTAWH